jgi:beta-lactamase class D
MTSLELVGIARIQHCQRHMERRIDRRWSMAAVFPASCFKIVIGVVGFGLSILLLDHAVCLYMRTAVTVSA